MNCIPPIWAGSAEAAALQQRLQSAPRSVLMLDYDGTLAPFRNNRLEAIPYPGVEERLSVLSGLSRVRLLLVTGRSAQELQALLAPDVQVEIWGSHGREWLHYDGSYELASLEPWQEAALEQVGRQLSALGYASALEIKPGSLAIHWRSLEPDAQERLRSVTQSIYNQLAEAQRLRLLPFDGGLELRSMDRTKGTVVGEILAQEPTGVPVAYLGDDLTDEDAFAAIADRGISILVRAAPRESSARFWLQPPQQLLDFLDFWIQATADSLSKAPR